MENEKIYDEILKNLILYNPVNKKVRFGHNEDGGYVVVDDYKYDCFISAGIAKEITFETDFMNNNPNIVYYAFDGTVNRPAGLSSEIIYIKKNIDFNNSETTTNLKEYAKNFNDIFIKMDIEGEEFNWIRSFDESFTKVKQFVFEAHAIFPEGVPNDKQYYSIHYKNKSTIKYINDVLESLKILNKTHYLVHVHENINGPFIEYMNNLYPTFMELTYIRKDCEIDGLNKYDLPIKNLDFPCGSIPIPPGTVDMELNFYPFKF